MDHTTKLNLSKPGARGTHPSSNELRDAIRANADIVETEVENLYESYRTICRRMTGVPGNAAMLDKYLLSADGRDSSVGVLLDDAAGYIHVYAFYFDPAVLSAGSRTKKVRLVATCNMNFTAYAGTFNVTLAPVSSIVGTSSNWPKIHTNGAAVITVPFAAPGVNASLVAASADVTAPAAGLYCMFVSCTGAAVPAAAYASITAELQMRAV